MLIRLPRKPSPAVKASSAPAQPASPPAQPSGEPQGPAGRFVTVRELARHWKLSERQVRRLIASGFLKVHRLGRSVRIAERDILAFERSRG